MEAADEQIRVSEAVKRRIERRRREGESYNDVLERLLGEAAAGDFEDGFGRWADEEADRVRKARRESNEDRKRRMVDRSEDAARRSWTRRFSSTT